MARPVGLRAAILLDLAFLVFDMGPLDGVVFVDRHLFSHGAGVLLGHVEMPGASRRVQTDLDRRRFGHVVSPASGSVASREILEARLLAAQRAESTAISGAQSVGRNQPRVKTITVPGYSASPVRS